MIELEWVNHSSLFCRDGEMSESEGEDTTETVGVPQKMSSKISKGMEEVGVKLVELGPRLRMQVCLVVGDFAYNVCIGVTFL
jgi:hypothetical protein